MRGSSGETQLNILEGKIKGQGVGGGPGLTWMDDIGRWTEIKTYGEIKRNKKKKKRWNP